MDQLLPGFKVLELRGTPEISVVVPLFNEEANFRELYERLTNSLEALELNYELVFVNDGSSDSTAALMDATRLSDPRLVAVHLSRNFGHQAAISAGIDRARGQAVIVMDGDLQDPPEVLGQFIEKWREGFQVVFAIRANRKEHFLKRLAYYGFYRILRAVSDLNIPLDSGDFCLMDRKVVEVLRHLPEQIRFVRGLRTFVGFRQIGLKYERAARSAGTPKYSFRALIGLATDGLISFSSYPLHLATYLGLATAAAALLVTLWALIDTFYEKTAPRGWASTIVVVLCVGAMQLVCQAITGQYVRRIFLEVKRRPTYIVDERDATPSSGSIAVPRSDASKIALELDEFGIDLDPADRVRA